MDESEEFDDWENVDKTNYLNIIKISSFLGFHLPDEEFSEGYNFSINIANSINKYFFFTFDCDFDRFYGLNKNKKKYTLNEISIGVGMFFNFLRFQNNNTYVGAKLGTYHIKNTSDIKFETKNAGNHLMIAWILGHSYSITDRVYLEGLIRLKANHLRNLSINLGVGYRIVG